jgi:tetratricopeptide (TPR) repeat protein
VDFFVATYLFSDDGAARLAAAETALTKALSLAPNHAFAHYCLGVIFGVTARAEEGIAECERALALDGNFADAHAVIGARKLYLGRAEETQAHVQEALRLSPRDTRAFLWLMFVGTAKIYLGRYEEVVARLRRAVEINRNHPMAHFFLAAALAHLGRHAEARAAAQHGLALNPTFTVSRLRASVPSDNPTYLAQRHPVYPDRARKASSSLLRGIPWDFVRFARVHLFAQFVDASRPANSITCPIDKIGHKRRIGRHHGYVSCRINQLCLAGASGPNC